MRPLVHNEHRALVEGLAADRAAEGLLPRVDALVFGQVGLGGVTFAALGAQDQLCPLVNGLVRGKVVLLPEAFATL